MTEQFTEADVQLVAEAMWQKLKDTDFPNLSGPPTAACFEDARAILSALAEAGRLVPDGAERDLDVLTMVGRMYLDALDADPANEMLTLPQAMLVTEVRDAVERRERAWVEADEDSTPDREGKP